MAKVVTKWNMLCEKKNEYRCSLLDLNLSATKITYIYATIRSNEHIMMEHTNNIMKIIKKFIPLLISFVYGKHCLCLADCERVDLII